MISYTVVYTVLLGRVNSENPPRLGNSVWSGTTRLVMTRISRISFLMIPIRLRSALILAVPYNEYLGLTTGDFRAYLKQGGVLFDLKGVLPLGEADLRL
jgi:hypothetical protein